MAKFDDLSGKRIRITFEFTNTAVHEEDSALTQDELDEFVTDGMDDERAMGIQASAMWQVFHEGQWVTA